MCLCNVYLQAVTAAVDVNHPEQFMEALNKGLFSLAAVQKKKNKPQNPNALGTLTGVRAIKDLL